MHLTWLMNPLVAYGVAALGLMTTLVLFASIRWEMARGRQETIAQAGDFQTARESDRLMVRTLETEVHTLRESVNFLQQIPAARPNLSINLTRRAQALRMYRRGEPLQSIAAALECPGNEIALLLKVQAISSENNQKVS